MHLSAGTMFWVGVTFGVPAMIGAYFLGWRSGFDKHGEVSWQFAEMMRDMFISLNVTPPDNPFERFRPKSSPKLTPEEAARKYFS